MASISLSSYINAGKNNYSDYIYKYTICVCLFVGIFLFQNESNILNIIFNNDYSNILSYQNLYINLFGKILGKRSLRRPRRREEDNVMKNIVISDNGLANLLI